MGHVFDHLTKPGVSVDGKTTYYDNPDEATKAMVSAAAKTAQPSTSTINGTVGETPDVTPPIPPMAPPAPDAGDTLTTGFSSPTIDPASIPKSANQTFLAPTDANRPLTTKGEVLRLVLSGLTGAAAGAGERTASQGFKSGAGAELSADEAGQRTRQATLNNQLTQAQIDNLPMVRASRQAELDKTKAETANYEAQTNRRSYVNTKGGTLQIGPHGENFGILKGTEPEGKPDLLETVDGRKSFLSNLKQQYGSDYSFTPREEQEFQANGKIPVSSKSPDQMSASELALRAEADPDPSKRDMYGRALTRYGNATRPNNAAVNEETTDNRKKAAAGNATIAQSKFMTKAGGDHMKAIQQIDQFVSQNKLTPEQAAIIAEARKNIANEYRTTRSKGSPLDILNGILGTNNPTPAQPNQ